MIQNDGARTLLLRASKRSMLVATVALGLAALYGNYYALLEHHIELPDVSPSAGTLMVGYAALAVLFVAWSFGLSAAASPSAAARLLDRWRDLTRDEWRAARIGGWAAVSLALAYTAVRLLTNPTSPFATLEMLTAGEARLPFQYRTLVPWVAQAVHAVLPGLDLRVPYGLVDAASALAVYGAFRLFLRVFIARPGARALAALAIYVPLFFNLAAPHRYYAVFFPWDTPSVAFFTLGLYLLYRRAWWAFYPLFVVATFNRETTCFLTVFYVLTFFQEERPGRLMAHAAAQAAIWFGIKAALYTTFLGNEPLSVGDSVLFANQIGRSLQIVLTIPGLVYLALAMGGLWVLVAWLWPALTEARVKQAFRFVPAFLVGMVAVGELMEVRIYSELLPLATLAALCIGRNLVGALSEGGLPPTPRAPGRKTFDPELLTVEEPSRRVPTVAV